MILAFNTFGIIQLHNTSVLNKLVTRYISRQVIYKDVMIKIHFQWAVVTLLGDSYFVGQQQVPDLSQILLGEDKAHISFNVGQEPVNTVSC